MQALWDFLTVEENRAVLQWLGGGVMVVCGALWGLLKRRGASDGAPPAERGDAPDRVAPILPFALLLAAVLGLAVLILALAAGGADVSVRDGVGIGGDATGVTITNTR